MAIKWNTVTWYSQVLALILFIGVFALGYWLGSRNEGVVVRTDVVPQPSGEATFPKDVSYLCEGDMGVVAIYRESDVQIQLQDGREITLPQTISASGIRYANEDESFVFWSKGDSAFIEESGETTYANCKESPLPI